MALSDPQSITISGVPISLPRVSSRVNGSTYTSSDGLVQLSADHAYNKRTRRVLRIDHAKISADPFLPSQNVRQSMSTYIVFDLPVAGYTNAEALAVYTGFRALYTAATDSLITKLLGGES
jgi:hypothetical protein